MMSPVSAEYGEHTFVQMHAHSRASINRLSGEGAFHRGLWWVERRIMKRLMLSPSEISKEAEKMGVDYVAITDHNLVSDISGFNNLIQGEEWGQMKGHANFTFLKKSIDPECGFYAGKEPDKPNNFKSAAKIAKENGAFVSINHPFKEKADSWKWGDSSVDLCNAIEIWNGSWSRENEKSLEYWQFLLTAGKKILCMAGSDFHVKRLFRLDSPLICIGGKLSIEEIRISLNEGKYSLCLNTNSPVIFLHRGDQDVRYTITRHSGNLELIIYTAKEKKTLKHPLASDTLEFSPNDGFIRAEIWKDGVPLSFSNPVFY